MRDICLHGFFEYKIFMKIKNNELNLYEMILEGEKNYEKQ